MKESITEFLEDLGITKKVRNIITIVFLVLFVFIVVFKSAFTVGDSEQAVITTFGKVTKVVPNGKGLTFKIPFVQKVQKIYTEKTFALEIGYTTQNGGMESIDSESQMITGDFNIVNIDFFAEYTVSDPVKYIYSSANPEKILKDLIQGASRTVVGMRTVDDVLTTGKFQIESDIKELVSQNLDFLDIGLSIKDIKIQDSEPPTPEVQAAFKAVENAKQEKEQMLNEAYTYQNEKIPQAEADADKIIQEANAYKQEKINVATGEVKKLNDMYNEYIQYPNVTKTRMYYETIQKVLPNVKVVIDTSNGNNKLFAMNLDGSSNQKTINKTEEEVNN